jgi:5-methyltetrahydropteroyltriglutamate--homocysteine methyltransferase
MKRSTERILVSHAGVLPRPPDIQELLAAGTSNPEALIARLPGAVSEIVRKQVDAGIDVVNDGEYSKRGGFSGYVRDRFSGIEPRPPVDGADRARQRGNIAARDSKEFPGYYSMPGRTFGTTAAPRPGSGNQPAACTGPLEYIGQAAVQQDIANLKAALVGQQASVEGYLPAIAPGTIEHWLQNEHYPSEEAFLFAIADVMHWEYKAITDAGLILQIDDPDLPDGWQMFPDMSVADYRKYADLRVEAINRALAGIPESQVRLHICWGSPKGPHKNDIPLKDIVDIVLKVKAECFSIEAANPRHDHEWELWQATRLPDGKSFMPGVIAHITDHVEHPELVAQRLIRYANVMGRENVIAGTDCGMGTRVANAEICWAKLEAMVEGAAIASRKLWGRT